MRQSVPSLSGFVENLDRMGGMDMPFQMDQDVFLPPQDLENGVLGMSQGGGSMPSQIDRSIPDDHPDRLH